MFVCHGTISIITIIFNLAVFWVLENEKCASAGKSCWCEHGDRVFWIVILLVIIYRNWVALMGLDGLLGENETQIHVVWRIS